MTLQQLVTLAATTLADVPHQPAITPELCAAICWQESTGDPSAKGDRDKKTREYHAIGLAQFHIKTWDTFALIPCAQHKQPRCRALRDCPKCSMIALIRELNFAIRNRPAGADPLRTACNFHNAGKLVANRTAYVRKIKGTMVGLNSKILNLKSRRPAR